MRRCRYETYARRRGLAAPTCPYECERKMPFCPEHLEFVAWDCLRAPARLPAWFLWGLLILGSIAICGGPI